MNEPLNWEKVFLGRGWVWETVLFIFKLKIKQKDFLYCWKFSVMCLPLNLNVWFFLFQTSLKILPEIQLPFNRKKKKKKFLIFEKLLLTVNRRRLTLCRSKCFWLENTNFIFYILLFRLKYINFVFSKLMNNGKSCFGFWREYIWSEVVCSWYSEAESFNPGIRQIKMQIMRAI